jgi:hypothetical protein
VKISKLPNQHFKNSAPRSFEYRAVLIGAVSRSSVDPRTTATLFMDGRCGDCRRNRLRDALNSYGLGVKTARLAFLFAAWLRVVHVRDVAAGV